MAIGVAVEAAYEVWDVRRGGRRKLSWSGRLIVYSLCRSGLLKVVA